MRVSVVGRRWAALLLVSLAACSSTGPRDARDERAEPSATPSAARVSADATPGSSSPGATGAAGEEDDAPGDVRATVPGRRATEASGGPRGPITLGVLYAINDAAASAGIENGDTLASENVARAFVESFNESGGIAGRRIVPVYEELRSTSGDYEGDMQAVCSSFTQDHKVAAVLSNIGFYSQTLQTCLHRASVPIVSGEWVAPDQQDAERFPLWITPNAIVGDRRISAVVSHLKRSDVLKASSRIGVIVEDCPADRRIYQRALLPAFKRAGLAVAATFYPACFLSLQDYGRQTTQMSGAVLQFRQRQVDTVMLVSQGAEANLTFAFSTVAESQGWRPRYALSSTALPEGLTLNVPEAQLRTMRGVGWLPVVDTHERAEWRPTPTGAACLRRMKAKGITPTGSADHLGIYAPCDTFSLYDALLRATRRDPSAAAVRRAVSAVDYTSAFTLGGRVALTGGRLGPQLGRFFAYVPDKGFRYTSPAFRLF